MNVSTTSTIETTVETPTSEPSLGHLSSSTLSMRAKAERKRKASALHNSNFRAGFVPVTEDALHRTGIRGRKRYFLYCTLAVMMIVALLNTLVTAWLIYILGLTHMGLSSIEISTYGVRPVLRILHQAHIITLTLNGAPLGARHDSNIDFLTEESPLYVQTMPFDSNRGSSVSLDGPNITVTTECLRMRSPNTSKWFSADVESIASNFGISNFFVEDLVISKIQSRKDMKDLYLESATKEVGINASEGMNVKSDHDVEFQAKAIKLKSMGTCTLSAKHSIYLNPDLPKVPTRRSKTPDPKVHKVCVCGNGKLFLIPCTGPRTSCRIGKKVARTVCGK